jgi:hypothetical protein
LKLKRPTSRHITDHRVNGDNREKQFLPVSVSSASSVVKTTAGTPG